MNELLAKAKQGDSGALEEIASQYKGLIRSIVNKFYLVGGDKDDLLQEGMIGLFFAVNDYDEEKGAFSAFVQKCIFRRIVSAVRSSTGGKNKPLDNYVEISQINDVADESCDPLELVIGKETLANIMAKIEKMLSPVEKSVFNLFCEGYSYDEICSKLNISYKAVDSALQRARRKLISEKE